MYISTMDAVDSLRHGAALFVLQGPQQQVAVGAGLDQWGNGFTTNPVLVSQGCSGMNAIGYDAVNATSGDL